MTLHERIAEALGWTVAQCQSQSLPSLRAALKAFKPEKGKLIAEITNTMDHRPEYIRRTIKE